MTKLETKIITYPDLPSADITPLELLVLSNILECSETEEGLVLFTDMGPTNPIHVKRRALIEAFHASTRNSASTLQVFVASRVLADLPDGHDDPGSLIEIDMSEFPWQFIAQDILARCGAGRELVVIQWTNHPSQRPETFGTAVSLITARAIHHVTSEDLLGLFRRRDQDMPDSGPSAVGITVLPFDGHQRQHLHRHPEPGSPT